ncbi:MAG: hypothetical protein CL862_03745 [Cyanobium sp. NAT70]|nr:hypothetical protein [Cyanobium sp. NAT70]|tara:strand:+ start:2531 stop:3370 length:840 start_codon:yes stop_codon:yes gene_type:complete
MSQLIFSYGFGRTGTTWIFNAIREILNDTGLPWQSCFAKRATLKKALATIDEQKYFVVKTHVLNHVQVARSSLQKYDLKAKVIFPIRDPRDTICSRLRVRAKEGDLKGKLENMPANRLTQLLRRESRKYNELFNYLENNEQLLIIREPDIKAAPIKLLSEISTYILGYTINHNAIQRIATELSSDNVLKTIETKNKELGRDEVFKQIDEDTQFHANHIRKEDYDHQWLPEQQEIAESIVKKQELIINKNLTRQQAEDKAFQLTTEEMTASIQSLRKGLR